jgi:hypothetical protein
MEAQFACLEALVISMVSNMVAPAMPHAFGLGGIRDQEDILSFCSILRYFYGIGFSKLMAPYDVWMDIP